MKQSHLKITRKFKHLLSKIIVAKIILLKKYIIYLKMKDIEFIL